MPFSSPEKVDALVAVLLDQIHRGLRLDEVLANLQPYFVEKLQAEVDKRTAEINDLKGRLEQENALLRSRLAESSAFAMLTALPGLAPLCRSIEQVAAADTTVLITGETGVGKELVAKAIHELSPRRERLLVPVNCAALPQELTAAELFGNEVGAYTGANKRREGRFELAHHGTLFLDEIAEINQATQVLLLRVLQERVIERVGGTERIAVDVRLITATNKHLETLVQANTFRADLFYRLNVFPLHVPPLRERRDDIPHLVNHFVKQFNARMRKNIVRVTPAVLAQLMAYPWPGNVRELENIIERGMIVSPGETLGIDPTWLNTAPATTTAWEESERQTIIEALRRAHGKLYGPGGAAELLGLKGSTLASKMKKLGISRDS